MGVTSVSPSVRLWERRIAVKEASDDKVHKTKKIALGGNWVLVEKNRGLYKGRKGRKSRLKRLCSNFFGRSGPNFFWASAWVRCMLGPNLVPIGQAVYDL